MIRQRSGEGVVTRGGGVRVMIRQLWGGGGSNKLTRGRGVPSDDSSIFGGGGGSNKLTLKREGGSW